MPYPAVSHLSRSSTTQRTAEKRYVVDYRDFTLKLLLRAYTYVMRGKMFQLRDGTKARRMESGVAAKSKIQIAACKIL
jgi:hypothetical protein